MFKFNIMIVTLLLYHTFPRSNPKSAAGAGEVVTGFGAEIPGIGSYWIKDMQEMTSGFCNLMPLNTEGKLEDLRNNKTYDIAKLKDGNCWMTQNMDYAGDDLSKPHNGTNYKDVYGMYYNWENAKTVCNIPGWELPTHKQYTTLINVYGIENTAEGSTTLQEPPLNFLYGGAVNGDSLNNAGSSGYYWSSTPDNTNAYSLTLDLISVTPSGKYNHAFGLSVRCVAK